VKKIDASSSAFSIIEVLIWIFVFSLGLVSIYALLASALNINDYNKNSIIAWNLAREQIELVRNIRDTNYQTLSPFDRIEPWKDFEIWKYYTLGQDMSSWDIEMDEISDFWEWKSELIGKMLSYRLCLDAENRYVYCSPWLETTPFYRYVYIEQTQDGWVDIEDALTITSKVIWFKRWYHEFDIKTIITDWRRI